MVEMQHNGVNGFQSEIPLSFNGIDKLLLPFKDRA
jgi:hypothetical protein